MLRNCKDEIRAPLINGGLLRGALCLSAGLLSPPYGTGAGEGGVGVERVVAHNPQPPTKDNGITMDLFSTYGYLYVQVTYPRRRRVRIWSCLTPTEASGYLVVP